MQTAGLMCPAHNEEAYIGDCLTSVLTNGLGCFHEVIVVDNASNDRTFEIASARAGVRACSRASPGQKWLKARRRSAMGLPVGSMTCTSPSPKAILPITLTATPLALASLQSGPTFVDAAVAKIS
jgi:GT2 family glycosyltransferase